MTSCYHHLPVRFVRLAQIHRLLVLVQLGRIQFEQRQLVLDVLQLLVRLVYQFVADLELGKGIQRLVLALRGMVILRTVLERLGRADQRQFQLLGSRNLIQSRDAAMDSQLCQPDQQGSRFQPGSGNCSRRLAAGLVGKMVPSTME